MSVAADGGFVYSPPENFFGTDRFLYTANDFRPGNVAVVTLEIRPKYDAATAIDDFYTAQVGQSLVVAVDQGLLQNDLNPDQSNVAIELTQDVSDGALTLNQDGSFNCNPGEWSTSVSLPSPKWEVTSTSSVEPSMRAPLCK